MPIDHLQLVELVLDFVTNKLTNQQPLRNEG